MDPSSKNIVDCKIADFIDATVFREMIRTKSFTARPRAIFHYGAITTTTSTDGKAILDINYTYSKEVFHWCKDQSVRFIYASSAAVYGKTTNFDENAGMEAPLTIYGYFKMLLDQYVLQNVDLRSPQIVEFKAIQLLGDYDGVKGGEQKLDFVHVEDVARLNCWFLDHPEITGIFNVGTGVATTFNELAIYVAKHFGSPEGFIKIVDFPAELKGHYQSFTRADTSKLRRAGSTLRFRSVNEGIKEYMEWLEQHDLLTKAAAKSLAKSSSSKSPVKTPVKVLST
ncbi:NAD-dependent epimerase/dehydratase [Penicillium soppii]|uniref:NAD-dependent epimerase/dehydratase n=1 Tax=Penicillium soppii TaxID=69789 RepID=UPI0025470C41|nr:NAD-dependent epimerase/dehydratase [Penicillium soppii]KAJ5861742.1 NAD-dependent epimerase/dehydratase [Penicillium soppii]